MKEKNPLRLADQDDEANADHLRWAEARLKAGLTHEPENLEPSDLDLMGRFEPFTA